MRIDTPMPAARYHTRATLALTAAVALAAPLYVAPAGPDSLALIPGCAAGLMLHPDLDQWRAPRSPWRWWWNWYAAAIPHRSCWSHCVGLGTLTRLAWLLIVPFAVLVVFGGAWMIGRLVLSPWFWWFVAGLAAADGLHVAMDWIF